MDELVGAKKAKKCTASSGLNRLDSFSEEICDHQNISPFLCSCVVILVGFCLLVLKLRAFKGGKMKRMHGLGRF